MSSLHGLETMGQIEEKEGEERTTASLPLWELTKVIRRETSISLLRGLPWGRLT